MEAVLMADFDHRNVMWLIAIMIDNDMKPHVLLPLMEHGDLRSFISKPTNVRIVHFKCSVFCTKYPDDYCRWPLGLQQRLSYDAIVFL